MNSFMAVGLGEIATALTLGVLVPGMGYLVAAGGFDATFVAFAIPFTLYGAAFILNVQIPDVEADRQGGKRTLVSRIGRQAGFLFAGTALLLASAYFFLETLVEAIDGHVGSACGRACRMQGDDNVIRSAGVVSAAIHCKRALSLPLVNIISVEPKSVVVSRRWRR